MIREFLCWIGFHVWAKVIYSRPTRSCICCGQKQQMFRGAGGDDWENIE